MHAQGGLGSSPCGMWPLLASGRAGVAQDAVVAEALGCVRSGLARLEGDSKLCKQPSLVQAAQWRAAVAAGIPHPFLQPWLQPQTVGCTSALRSHCLDAWKGPLSHSALPCTTVQRLACSDLHAASSPPASALFRHTHNPDSRCFSKRAGAACRHARHRGSAWTVRNAAHHPGCLWLCTQSPHMQCWNPLPAGTRGHGAQPGQPGLWPDPSGACI